MAKFDSMFVGSSSLVFTDIKLDGLNYRAWAFSVKTTLRGYGLASHLTDDPPDPKTVDVEAVKAWQKEDCVMARLVLSVDVYFTMSLEYHTSAKQMSLRRDMFSPVVLFASHCSRTFIVFSSNRGDSSSFPYVCLRTLTICCPESLIAVWIYQSDSHRSVDQLIAYRARQPSERHHGAPTEPPRALTGAVTAATSTSTVTSGSVSAMTLVAPSAPSAAHSWVLDSSASFHVTSDSSQLVAHRLVTDAAYVRIADDTPCSITHQSILSISCFSVLDDRQSRRVIGSGHRRRGSPSLYVLDTLYLPSTTVPITCKWVHKIKNKSDGSVERYKVRLVARGFQQTYGRDYDETFAPVAHMTTVRTLIAVAVVRTWTISHMDVKNAFLPGDLHEVYMQPLPGVEALTDYVCRLRPDIAHAVYVLSQFVSAPTSVHYSHVLCVLRYLRGTAFRRLFYASSSQLQLHAYSDSTWASDPVDRQSITGYCISLGTSLIAWKSKKQTAVSRSSAEAELRALAATTSEIIWLRWLLIDLSVHCDNPVPLFCDNTSAIQIASDPVKHKLTKHIGVDASFTRSHCQQSTIVLKYVPSELEVTYFFTKAQTREHHRLHLLKLSALDPPDPP
uniref:Putative retrotransposon protein n=1 Tax=Phyllostachys edulis TaxID=38705 RepID=D3IVT5_PHYED|nr:putative retrotransposon protein [Phyllostachys edulis]